MFYIYICSPQANMSDFNSFQGYLTNKSIYASLRWHGAAFCKEMKCVKLCFSLRQNESVGWNYH